MKLKIELNRIDGTVALPSLHPDNVVVDGDEAAIYLLVSASHDIDLYFPASGPTERADWLGLARDVLNHLTEMDNEVQRVCAEQCERSGIDSRNYEGELACITLTGPDTVELHYYGTRVNTEWDEYFVQTQGKWNAVKPAEHGAAANGEK